jgi:predicted RNase H-like nuclease (RuvC/YqgF family)
MSNLTLNQTLNILRQIFADALGKFSEAFVQHIQTELKKVTHKFDSLCTEIKSSSKMVITDQSKDPANVVQEIQNLNDTISKQNMETMSLKHKVQSLTLNNKTKQNEMDNKLQVMRSDYELEIAKLQSNLDTQSQLTSDAKQQLNHTTHILNNSIEHLEQKLVAKNSEISNLEGICANLRLDLETKSNAILSLKIHAANSTSFNEKSDGTKKKTTV